MLGTIQTNRVLGFFTITTKKLLRLLYQAVFRSKDLGAFSFHFAEFYSILLDFAEHSVSNPGFDLPTALGMGASSNVNRLLAKMYGGTYACLSYGGSSGAILMLLTAVLPKLHPGRELILFDEACHQSAIGGLIFGRWKAVRIPRNFEPAHGTTRPIALASIKALVEKHGADKIAAIILVVPTYDGFRSKSEEANILTYTKAHGILLILDGAWGSTSFHDSVDQLTNQCDLLITSPHKRGLCPSSLGCMVTNREDIAQIWDGALDLGFRSTSISFVETMVAEHRVSQVLDGSWSSRFEKAELAATAIRQRISEVHPAIYVVEPEFVGADCSDAAHILISTSEVAKLDARQWARALSKHFSVDVEKATSTTLLLLCASPAHLNVIDQTLDALRTSLHIAINQNNGE